MYTCQNIWDTAKATARQQILIGIYIDIWKRYVRDFLKICHKIKRASRPALEPFCPLHGRCNRRRSPAAWEPALFHKVILSSPMIKSLTGGVPWPLTVLIAHAECLLGKEEFYVLGQKPYDGTDTFQTSAGTSEPKFARYNDLRKEKQFLQTCAPSYGWLKAAIKMSWYLRYHGWQMLSPHCLFFVPKKTISIRPRTSEIRSEKIKQAVLSLEYVYMPGRSMLYCGTWKYIGINRKVLEDILWQGINIKTWEKAMDKVNKN